MLPPASTPTLNDRSEAGRQRSPDPGRTVTHFRASIVSRHLAFGLRRLIFIGASTLSSRSSSTAVFARGVPLINPNSGLVFRWGLGCWQTVADGDGWSEEFRSASAHKAGGVSATAWWRAMGDRRWTIQEGRQTNDSRRLTVRGDGRRGRYSGKSR
jgi:hypothetical protein